MVYDELLLVDDDGVGTLIPLYENERMLSPGDQIRVGGLCWEIVHMSGHRPGSTEQVLSLRAEPCLVERP
jgi:glyoxylase-like metal-dependent hydrolase (beta-lactamase superfamily II)